MAKLNKQSIDQWAKRVNGDKVFKVIGKYLTAKFLLGIGDDQYFVVVKDGKIDNLTDEVPGAGTGVGWQFALRAPAESWEKFSQAVPPPMYNDIWAMAHPLHGKLKIEGDAFLFWQNLRALAWMLDLMRQA